MHFLSHSEAEQVTEVQSVTYVFGPVAGALGQQEVIAWSTEEISAAGCASCSGRRLV